MTINKSYNALVFSSVPNQLATERMLDLDNPMRQNGLKLSGKLTLGTFCKTAATLKK